MAEATRCSGGNGWRRGLEKTDSREGERTMRSRFLSSGESPKVKSLASNRSVVDVIKRPTPHRAMVNEHLVSAVSKHTTNGGQGGALLRGRK